MEEKRYLQEETEYDLRDFWYVFCQHALAIILACMIGGGAVFAACRYLITPTYEATAKLYVVSASNDSVVNLSDLQIGSNLTADYKELLLGRPMMESVIRQMKLTDETVETLRDRISITNPSGTRILEITANMESPELAADTANAMANLALTWLPTVMECNDPNIAEEAVAPLEKATPHTLRDTAIGAVGCGALVYFIYVLTFLMNDTVTTAEDMEKYFNMTPMAAVPFSKEVRHDRAQSGKANAKKQMPDRKNRGGKSA